MRACAYLQEGDLSGEGRGPEGFDMSETETGAFERFMGTFLLRRARYFNYARHLFPFAAEPGHAEIKAFHPRPLTSPSLR